MLTEFSTFLEKTAPTFLTIWCIFVAFPKTFSHSKCKYRQNGKNTL